MLNVSWVQYPITRSKQAIYPSVLLFTEQYQTTQALQQNNTISYDEVFLERDAWCIGNMSRKIGQALVARDFTRNVVCQGLQFTKELIYISCKLKLVSRNRDRWDTTFLDALASLKPMLDIKWLMFSRYFHLLSDYVRLPQQCKVLQSITDY